MSIIELNTGSCQNCYKCIRECPLKAIAFKEQRAKVIDDECIYCGICVETCPRNARFIKNDIEQVKALIASGKPVYASVAPSWVGWYEGVDFAQMSAALKSLGFAGVEETAIGASEVSREYANLMQNGQMKNIIVTACSSVVMLIERYYPSLIKMLAPVSSPMMAHARLMRESYGDIKVVFFGPCLSKKYEASDPLSGGLVNHALTFANLDEWLEEKKVVMENPDEQTAGVVNFKSRLYPTVTGIIHTIEADQYAGYKPVSVDGVERCMQFFEELSQGNLEGLFVEANACPGSCVGGPVMRMHKKAYYQACSKVTEEEMPYDENPAKSAQVQFPHPRVFANRTPKNAVPTEEQIKEILARIGKYTPEQELNCGGCGYPTCRDKAVAVFQGKADINMCLPFFRERAENMSNVVIEHSPNGIITFDDNMLVQDINLAAEELFEVTRAQVVGDLMPAFYGENDFDTAKLTGEPVIKKHTIAETGRMVEQTTLYIKEHGLYLMLLKDISEEENQKGQMEQMRLHTVEVAQNVIDKQMRVAQEIASLLGETTAETKVALTNLKKSMDSHNEASK